MNFSERIGFIEPWKIIQTNFVEIDLTTDLWNVFYIQYFNHVSNFTKIYECDSQYSDLFIALWMNYFKNTIDNLPQNISENISNIKNHLFSRYTKWYYIYEIIEFTFKNYKVDYKDADNRFKKETTELLNKVWEANLSGYRFINGLFCPITSEQELKSIEDASINNDEYKTVSSHLNKALDLLSDKDSPDFNNSIKESILAVESYFKVFFNKPTISFGDALNTLEHKHGLDKQIKESISRIYGYCNNIGAIRHALKPGDSIDKIKLAESKYMLVIFSAFINYLKETLAE